MIKTTKLMFWLLFHFAVLQFAIVMMVAAVYPVHAQNPQVEELTRRITSLETLNLDHRLTVIETLLNDIHGDHWGQQMTMGGTALLILERAVQAFRKKVKEEDEE